MPRFVSNAEKVFTTKMENVLNAKSKTVSNAILQDYVQNVHQVTL